MKNVHYFKGKILLSFLKKMLKNGQNYGAKNDDEGSEDFPDKNHNPYLFGL
jgi:hypothetical protein